MAWFTCKVNAAGPASDGSETSQPVVYINLTDEAGGFADQWFFAADNSRAQMLAVALSAITVGATVQAALPDAPPPFSQIDRLYVNAP